jgi:hypothetical protein
MSGLRSRARLAEGYRMSLRSRSAAFTIATSIASATSGRGGISSISIRCQLRFAFGNRRRAYLRYQVIDPRQIGILQSTRRLKSLIRTALRDLDSATRGQSAQCAA